MEKEMPLVSIIVPTYNSTKFLEQCLDSVKDQTYQKIELIVVDNNSTDETKDIAKRYTDKVFNKGPERSAQVNFGVEQATGEYVYKIDSDFVLDKNVVRQCVEEIQKGFDAIVVHNSPDVRVSWIAKIRKFEVDMYKYDITHSSARFVKKEVYEAIGGFNEKITAGEDYDFQNKLNRGGYKTGFIEAEALHLGEPTSFWKHMMKYYAYGKDFVNYKQENKEESKEQLGFGRTVYFKNWKKFIRHPVLGMGFIIYNFFKFGFGGVGYLLKIKNKVMKEITTIIVPGVLSVKHPAKMKYLGYFSIGELFNRVIFNQDSERIVFNINVEKNPEKFLNKEYKQFSTYFKITKNDIYYERKYLGLRCKMLIKNFTSNKITVYVNNTYINFVKLRMDALYPVGVHLMDLFLLHILKDGDLVIHGASLYNPHKDDSFLIIAPPDTGKTYSTAKLVENGFKFLGEDLSYYQAREDSLICVPLTSTWGHHFSKSKLNATSWPIIGWFLTYKKEIVTDLFGSNCIKDKAKLNRIYIIEKSDINCLRKVDYDKEFLRKILIIQRNEFSYFKNMLIRAFEYINKIEVDEVMKWENESFEKLLKEKDLYLVGGKNYSEFYKLIMENERKFES
jgi:glycosyltransferase involved in cell wall biosynthesis